MAITLNGSNGAVFQDNGNVGIGTSSPNGSLVVRNGNTEDEQLILGNSLNTGGRDWRLGRDNIATGDFVIKYSDATDANNTTEAMRIDSAGRVTMPYQPIFSAQCLTDQVASVTAKFGEVFVEQGGISYNNTTGRITVPVAGKYRVTMNPFSRTGTAPIRVLVGVNNDAPSKTNHKGHCYTDYTGFSTISLNTIIDLAANDYIVFYVLDGTLYSQSTDRFNQVTVELIG